MNAYPLKYLLNFGLRPVDLTRRQPDKLYRYLTAAGGHENIGVSTDPVVNWGLGIVKEKYNSDSILVKYPS